MSDPKTQQAVYLGVLDAFKQGLSKDDDIEFRFIKARNMEPFEKQMNEIMAIGGWRVAGVDVSVSDHHYFAWLIRRKGI